MAYDTAIVIGLAMMSFAMIYLGMRLKGEKHAPLQILFVSFALFMMLTNLAVMGQLANNETQSEIENMMAADYGIMVYVIIFFIFYLIIMFIAEVLVPLLKARYGQKV